MASAAPDLAPHPPRLGIAFSFAHRPLVAVAGLCGGAGTSTVAHLVAAAAARETDAAVLLADTGATSGALALYAGARSRGSLLDLAETLDRDHAPAAAPFATATDGLRVLAAGPHFPPRHARPEAVQEVLWHARAAHDLTVLDCGALAREADLVAVRCATHVLWVVPANATAVARADEVLAVLDLDLPGREIVLARHEAGERPAALHALTALAHRRRAPLAQMPHVADLHDLPLTERLDQASVALQALARVLAR